MRTSEQVYIHRQLEPDEVLRTGNAKRHKPLWCEIADAEAEWRNALGEEEYKERIKEWNDRKLKNNNDE